ncbi:hypothetical protein SFRURICE_014911 [Spodoptera frugiperda]|nr:hypothetical protein SFRURICE_014911 [Spodoptera frugiperda]
MFSKIFIITLIVGIASAGIISGRHAPKPAALAHKEGCYIEDINDVIPYGGNVTRGDCTQVVCGKELLNYFSCGAQANTIPNCKLVGDLSKPYPECCPVLQCA